MTKKEKLYDLQSKACMVELELFKTFTPEQHALYQKMDDLVAEGERIADGEY